MYSTLVYRIPIHYIRIIRDGICWIYRRTEFCEAAWREIRGTERKALVCAGSGWKDIKGKVCKWCSVFLKTVNRTHFSTVLLVARVLFVCTKSTILQQEQQQQHRPGWWRSLLWRPSSYIHLARQVRGRVHNSRISFVTHKRSVLWHAFQVQNIGTFFFFRMKRRTVNFHLLTVQVKVFCLPCVQMAGAKLSSLARGKEYLISCSF